MMNISKAAALAPILLLFSPVSHAATGGTRRRTAADTTTTTTFPFDHSVEPKAVQTKIIGGSPAGSGEYPYFATTRGNVVCGASVIHEDILLTAAHCLGAFADGVVVNTINRPPNWLEGEHRSVTHQTRHLEYNDVTIDNDIMILKLDQAVSATPVPYSTNPGQPSGGETLTVMGFGLTSEGGYVSSKLMEVDVQAVSHATCNAQYAAYGGISQDSMFCAAASNKDSCQGDSGGPIIDQSGIQMGIVSWGVGCAWPNYPGVYARVGNYADWIKESICQLSSNPPTDCPTPSSPPEGSVKVRVHVQNKHQPKDNVWYIQDDQDTKVAEQVVLSKPNEVVDEIVNLLPGSYKITMEDTFKNGFDGSFAVIVEDDDGTEYKLAESTGHFVEFTETLEFTLGNGEYSEYDQVTSFAAPLAYTGISLLLVVLGTMML